MSDKVSAKVKARRQQHRDDHFTDNDRQLFQDYKGDQQGRRAARQKALGAQGNKSASDFNFDQYGKGHVSSGEVRSLMNQGQSKSDIMSAAKASGAEIGKRAQNKFNRWENQSNKTDYKKQYTDHFNKIGTSAEDSANLIADYERNTKGLDQDRAFKALEGGRQFDPKGGDQKRYDAQQFLNGKTAEVKDSFNTTDSFNTDIDQTQSFDRTFGSNENTIGDNNKFFGNVNQGNQDFSINIGNQQAGAGGTAGGGTMSNAAEGAAAKAGFENTWERSNAKFNPMAFAASNIAAADELGGTSNLIKGLDQTTDANIDYYRKASDRSTLGIYGDIWNMKAPTWKSPGDLEKIETTYDKTTEEEEKQK